MTQTTVRPKPLRVLYAFDGAPYPVHYSGGAQRSGHEIMAALTARGLKTMVIASRRGLQGAELTAEDEHRLGVKAVVRETDAVVYDCGYPVVVMDGDFEAGLRRRMDEFAPDVVFTHLRGALSVLRMAKAAGAVPIWFVRDAECVVHPQADLDEALGLGARLMVSSPFLWNHLLTQHGVDSTVIYPLVDPGACTALRTGEFITLVNPVLAKGLGIFVRFVEKMPDLRFLVCEGWKDTVENLQAARDLLRPYPQVRLMPAASDVREIFSQTRLLLMPSLWLEGFGRVALEAQFNGIPVVASRRGGLADFRDGIVLVEDFLNPDAWVRTIRAILGDQALYQRLSERARQHAQRPDLSEDHLIDSLLGAVTATVRTSPISR